MRSTDPVRWLRALRVRTVVCVGALLVAATVPAHAQPTRASADSASRGVAEPLAAAAYARTAARVTGRYDAWFRKYTKRYFGIGTDWTLFKSQAVAESELNPNARSAVGARGLMQLMPATFALIAQSSSWMTSIDAPEANIAAGIRFDRDLWKSWEHKVTDDELARFAFASYNAGEGTILRARGVAESEQLDPSRWENIARVAPKVRRWRHAETLGYVEKIEATHQALKHTR